MAENEHEELIDYDEEEEEETLAADKVSASDSKDVKK
jgi:hypothetical protein